MIRLDVPPANDNGFATPARRAEQTPVVSAPADRAEHTYACSGNLILPLRFARRFPGWTAPEGKTVTR